jgi:hypothetical protein
MNRRKILITSAAFVFILIMAWSPWITEKYAVDLVTDHLESENDTYDYLGNLTKIEDIPKTSVKIPFGVLVYLPGEAVFFVIFFGIII